MMHLRMGILAAIVLMASSLGAFGVSSVLARSSPQQATGNGTIIVSTIEEAREHLDFEPSIPKFVPLTFERGSIMIQPNTPLKGRKSPNIMQLWGSIEEDDSAFIAVKQDPELDGLVGGQPALISGIEGERAIYGPLGSRPYSLVAFYWRDGDTAYTVAGSLVDSLTEDMIKSVAESLIPAN